MAFFHAVACMDEDSARAGDSADRGLSRTIVIISLFKHFIATNVAFV